MSEDVEDRDAREKRTVLLIQAEEDARRAELARDLGRRGAGAFLLLAAALGGMNSLQPARRWEPKAKPQPDDNAARQLQQAQERRARRNAKRLRASSKAQ